MDAATISWSAAIVGLLGYEGYALATGKKLLTTVVRDASKKYPLVPFLAGILMGHFFWCW